MVVIEFFGIPRLRAGTNMAWLNAETVAQALRELGRLYPTLADDCLAVGNVPAAYRLSLNADRFVSDPETPLSDGDTLLLMSADVGG